MLLVTGSHRSGTTWVGRMLCASGQAGYIHEPFHPWHRSSWMRVRPQHLYEWVGANDDTRFDAELDRILRFRFPVSARLAEARQPADVRAIAQIAATGLMHRLQKRRPLLKDPMALFATPWLVEHFGVTPVLVVRHPRDVVSSVLRLGWLVDPAAWTEQPGLCDELLAPWKADVARADGARPVEKAALAWKVMYGLVDQFRHEHPSWIVVRHEDLTRDPGPSFAALYRELGLTFADEARRRVCAAAHGDSGSAGLDPVDEHLVRDITGEVASRFYGDRSWLRPGDDL